MKKGYLKYILSKLVFPINSIFCQCGARKKTHQIEPTKFTRSYVEEDIFSPLKKWSVISPQYFAPLALNPLCCQQVCAIE